MCEEPKTYQHLRHLLFEARCRLEVLENLKAPEAKKAPVRKQVTYYRGLLANMGD